MTRKLTSIAAIVLTILTAELLHAWAHAWFHHNYYAGSPYKSVGVSMLVAVAVFYPMLKLLEKVLHGVSERYMEGSKTIARNGFIGLLLGFSIAVFFLFVGFSIIWLHKNPLDDLKVWFSSLL